ncbi:HesA/MoeB/ThiF family protein [Thermodesulfobacterium sp. TA1]|uniref:HesA/MoeB/ThiF family protein n=1 Tax=Thermodesulfobacterium sp. TA1 TaxID=2234087 RepID=UPI001232D224|nr:HesA/MoeB/ThiF family protein [Thermodesulfobacterium sp. TA1]
MLSLEEQKKLKDTKVLVAGCGGLGGYVVEMLARLGIGFITVVDDEVFEETNLNRQLFSDVNTIGKKKALVAKERILAVNPEVSVNPVLTKIEENNAKEILAGHEMVVDALDSIPHKILLERTCEDLKIPLIHGAIAGWYGQVTTVLPGDKTLSIIYKNRSNGIEKELGTPSFSPAVIAGIQVSEVVKISLKRGEILSKKLLYVDLLNQEYHKIELHF